MNRDLEKFIPRFIRFVFPYSVVAIFTVIVFYKSGEIFWVNRTLQAQTIERKNFICGTAYTNLPNYFRWAAVENCKPKVIALGSSRVLQFRSGFFKDSISFYTTGGVFHRIGQLRAFLESIPEENLPKAIILGLDQWWFNSRYDSAMTKPNDLIFNQFSWTQNFEGLQSWQKFYLDWWNGKIKWSKLQNENHSGVEWLGISARMQGLGYRKDGSRAYGNIISGGTMSSRIKTAIDSVRTNNGLFRWTTEPDKNAINELRTLLRFCKKHNITVTGFLPPIHYRVLNEMQKQPEHFSNFFLLYNLLYPIFRENSFYVYDFTVPENYGSSDAEMVDAVHGSEKSFLRLQIQLLRKEGYLSQYSDSVYLKIRLDSAKGNFNVFGNQ
ncbi:MAG: hypothetical protein WCI97_09505 [Bacteroidota bacterium]